MTENSTSSQSDIESEETAAVEPSEPAASEPKEAKLSSDLALVQIYLTSDIDSDDDSLESHLKNLVRKSKTNEIRQDSLSAQFTMIENYLNNDLYQHL